MKVWIMTALFLTDCLEQATDKLDRQTEALALRVAGDTLAQAEAMAELIDRKRRLVNLAVLAHRIECGLTPEELSLVRAAVTGLSIADTAKRLELSRTTVFRKQRLAFRHAETICKRLGFEAQRMLADYGSIALCRRGYTVCARRCRKMDAVAEGEEERVLRAC